MYMQCPLGIIFMSFHVIAGYRLLRITTYLVGVTAGFILSYMIFLEFSHLAYPLVLCISGSIAVSFGFVTMLVEAAAVICLALQSAVCTASVSCLILYTSLPETPSWLLHLLTVTFSIIVILASLPFRLQKPLLIFSTSVLGAGLVATFLDNFLFDNLTLAYLHQVYKLDAPLTPCLSVWVAVGVCIGGAAVGILVQSLITARKIVHHKGRSRQDDCSLIWHDRLYGMIIEQYRSSLMHRHAVFNTAYFALLNRDVVVTLVCCTTLCLVVHCYRFRFSVSAARIWAPFVPLYQHEQLLGISGFH